MTLELIVPPCYSKSFLSSASAYFLDYLHQPIRSHVQIYLTALHIHKLNISLMIVLFLFPFLALEPPLLSITSGSSWLYVEWNAQSATFRVLYRESGAPDYQVIVPTTSQLSHNISALQPNTLYNIVVEATHTVTQQKVNSSVTEAYTKPHGELQGIFIIQFPLKYNVKTSAAFGLTARCSGEHIWTYIMHATVTITLDSVTDSYYYTYIQ